MARETTYERWFVFGVGQRPPSYEHITALSAENEAKRLAREHPGMTFYVLKMVNGFRLAETPLDEIVPDPDDIPF